MAKIAIPIETKVRELDGKIWLALNLVAQNNGVLLGPDPEIRQILYSERPDVYITKDPGDSTIEFFDQLRSTGISVCALDPEGAVFDSLDTYTHNKKKILNHIDAFFAWGESPANAILDYYKNKSNMYITGNPRFDLLQPQLRHIYQKRSQSLTKQYQNYIQINGNFSYANPLRQDSISKFEERYGKMDINRQIYNNRIFHRFIDAIYFLHMEFPETNIIIRPHPTADNNTYREEFEKYDRIHIEDSGDVRTWIAGANVTIHHDCTTGIESALMGVPTVSYRPIQNANYSKKLPQAISEKASSLEGLADYVSKNLKNRESYELTAQQKNTLRPYFQNIDELSTENICPIIDDLESPANKRYERIKPDFRDKIEWRVSSSRWSDHATIIYDNIQNAIGNESNAERRDIYRKKFPGLKQDEILMRIEEMQPMTKTDSVSVEKVSMTSNTFLLK